MRGNLRKVTKSVRGKHGTVRRSYWVKGSAPPAKQGFLSRHKGKIALGAAAVGTGLLASRHRLALRGAYHGAAAAHHENRAISGSMRKFGKSMGAFAQLRHVLAGAKTGAAVGHEMTSQNRGGWRRLRQGAKAVASGRNVTAYLAASKALHGYA